MRVEFENLTPIHDIQNLTLQLVSSSVILGFLKFNILQSFILDFDCRSNQMHYRESFHLLFNSISTLQRPQNSKEIMSFYLFSTSMAVDWCSYICSLYCIFVHALYFFISSLCKVVNFTDSATRLTQVYILLLIIFSVHFTLHFPIFFYKCHLMRIYLYVNYSTNKIL